MIKDIIIQILNCTVKPTPVTPYYEPAVQLSWSSHSYSGGWETIKRSPTTKKPPYHCVSIVDEDELVLIREQKAHIEKVSMEKRWNRVRSKAITKFLAK
jgi:hypothetical protein